MSEEQKIKPQMIFTDETAPVDEPDEVLEDIKHLQDRMVFGEDEQIKYEVEVVDKIDETVSTGNNNNGTIG